MALNFMKKILSVYVNLQDERLDLPSCLDSKKFIISICPESIVSGKFSEEGIKEVKKYLDEGCLLGQRGYKGICPYPHDDGTDPWHENLCLYNPPIEFEEQKSLMMKGMEVLKDTFGIKPSVYAPINHLYDENTSKAASLLDYHYLMDLNFLGLKPYAADKITIIPEAKMRKGWMKSIGVYTHVDLVRRKDISHLVEKAELVLPSEIPIKNAPSKYFIKINGLLKFIQKNVRDLSK